MSVDVLLHLYFTDKKLHVFHTDENGRYWYFIYNPKIFPKKWKKTSKYIFHSFLAKLGALELAWEIWKNQSFKWFLYPSLIPHREKSKLVIFPLQPQNVLGDAKNVSKQQLSVSINHFELGKHKKEVKFSPDVLLNFALFEIHDGVLSNYKFFWIWFLKLGAKESTFIQHGLFKNNNHSQDIWNKF